MPKRLNPFSLVQPPHPIKILKRGYTLASSFIQIFIRHLGGLEIKRHADFMKNKTKEKTQTI
jgi:hypothetical protein